MFLKCNAFKTRDTRCVLAVVDVFSWFVWLRPLEGKNSEEIAKELTAIYQEHGPPKNIRYAQFHDIYIPTAIEQLNVAPWYNNPARDVRDTPFGGGEGLSWTQNEAL